MGISSRRLGGLVSVFCLASMWLLGAGKTATAPLVVRNGDFEAVTAQGRPAVWGSWWHREKLGSATLSTEAHQGKHSIRLQCAGTFDWAFTHPDLFPVPVGGEYVYSAWAKVSRVEHAIMQIVSYDKSRKRLAWDFSDSDEVQRRRPGWQRVMGYFKVPPEVAFVSVRLVGSGPTDVLFDDLRIVPGKEHEIPRPAPKPKVNGHLKVRVDERLGRGVFAQETPTGVYVSWRLLKSDAAQVGFDVYRSGPSGWVKVNGAPILQTCDFTHAGGRGGDGVRYAVCVSGATPSVESSSLVCLRQHGSKGAGYRRIALSRPDVLVGKVGVGDLDGDGEYDYVVQHPSSNVDPWNLVWYASKQPLTLEAYTSSGKFLWSYDRGWSIETGIWYSPFVVADLNGDGRAEVALKAAEGDWRNPDGPEKLALSGCKGMVERGPEYLMVLDGMTGREIARCPWPSREDFSNYNFASRNQLAVARLDGRTPCLIALRGTYTLMRAEAWQLKDGKLEQLWSYTSNLWGRRYRGQGAHTTLVADVDGDGRDEIILGSAVLDDNGDPLWTTGRGHPDGVFYGDIIPSRPGMEVAYNLETAQREGGLTVVDGATGKTIWALQEPTKHVHGSATCADISVLHPGVELAGSDADGHKLTNRRWLFTGDGKLLQSGPQMPFGFGVPTVYWDADLQKEIFRGGKLWDYEGGICGDGVSGRRVFTADLCGDWREEIVTALPGEIRIYSTNIPAMDRRVCLMQDDGYRLCQVSNAMGYSSCPLLRELPSATAPNLNLTCMVSRECLRVAVTAPVGGRVSGVLRLTAPRGVSLPETGPFKIELGSEGIWVKELPVICSETCVRGSLFTGRLTLDSGVVLRGQVPLDLPKSQLRQALFIEAESYVKESGGKVRIRRDKSGVRGTCLSHWDAAGHELTWRFQVKERGRYSLAVRYCTGVGTHRSLWVDGASLGSFFLPETGGLGSNPGDWDYFYPTRNDQRLVLDLKPGWHELRMVNTGGGACNLDYLALVKAGK